MNDLGEYCRRIETHLTKANAGHLVRIVGPGFDLVRQWANAGVPLSVVFRGIDLKAERHREGAAKRPLRIEFCASDVQSIFDHWKRAVGVGVFEPGTSSDEAAGHDVAGESAGESASESADASPRRRSLGRHLDRAIERLSKAAARLDMPDGLRAECARILDALAAMKDATAGRRGDARDEAVRMLLAFDVELGVAARRFITPDVLTALRGEAELDLSPFRARLASDAWARSVDVTVDRIIRDRFSLPGLEL